MSSYSFTFGDADSLLPRIEPKPWMRHKKMVLVTAAALAGVVDKCIAAGRYGLDLETTGLDVRVQHGETVDKVVGICLSPDGVHGYYVPLRHKVGVEHNVSFSIVDPEMRRLLASPAVARFHNGKFDQEFIEHTGAEPPWGEFDKPSAWEDSMILAYLRNSRARQKGLKFLSKTELDMEMIELAELFGPDHVGGLDFSLLDPSWEPVLWYACSDAICTFLLVDKLLPQVVPAQSQIYKIEKGCIAATRWMERNLVTVDRAKVSELITLGQCEMWDSLLDVYKGANELLGRDVMPAFIRMMEARRQNPDQRDHDTGRLVLDNPKDPLTAQMERFRQKTKGTDSATRVIGPGGKEYPPIYDVLSPQQLGPMFEELQVPGLMRTKKSDQVMTTKAELDRITSAAGDKFPFMKRIKRFRETLKALSTYLLPLYEDSDWRDMGPERRILPEGLGSLHINYDGTKVDTGRFSTPGKKVKRKGDGLHGGTRYPMHGTPSTADPNRPECLLRIRECLVARPGKWIAGIDYAGVELRLVTNLSGEPKWVREFFRCDGCNKEFDRGNGSSTPEAPPPYCPSCGSDKIGDLHTLTSLEVYGADARTRPDWKNLRGNGKKTNFLLCYGGGGGAVQRSINVDKNEGWRIKRKFDGTYSGLLGWWDNQHRVARKHGYVLTAFGRHYPVPDINHESKGFRGKAERNAVNGPIQGSSADITKLAMVLIYQEFKKRGWLNKAMMTITMHDELVFEIDADILEEAIHVARHLMTSNPFVLGKAWTVPLTTDCEFGRDWTVPYDLKKLERKGVPAELDGLFPLAAAKAAIFKALAPDLAIVVPKGEKDKSSWSKAVDDDDEEGAEEAQDPADDVDDDDAPPEDMADAPPAPPAQDDLGVSDEPAVSATPKWNSRVDLFMPGVVVDATGKGFVDKGAAVAAAEPVKTNQVTSQAKAGPAPLAKGETFEYRLRVPLSFGTLDSLAKVIRKCRGQGSKSLRVITREGQAIQGWEDLVNGGLPIQVNEQQFWFLADDLGL